MNEHVRPDWDEYFLGIAEAVAARGECTRSLVGAVLVRDRRIVATGYNGALPGEPSCLDGACPRGRSGLPRGLPYDTEGAAHCIALHAETNVVLDCARRGVATAGATIYVTKEPCERCYGTLAAASVLVVWRDLTVGRGATLDLRREVRSGL